MSDPAANGAITGGANAIVFDLKQLTRFSDASPQGIILAETGAAQIVLLCMHTGQGVHDVHSTSQIIVQALRGRATLRIEEHVQPLRAGLIALVEAAARHSLVATTDCVLLLTITPSPEHEVAHDLLANLAPLVMRDAPAL